MLITFDRGTSPVAINPTAVADLRPVTMPNEAWVSIRMHDGREHLVLGTFEDVLAKLSPPPVLPSRIVAKVDGVVESIGALISAHIDFDRQRRSDPDWAGMTDVIAADSRLHDALVVLIGGAP